MAIRVRKLAKKLGRSPKELLGILHAVGITRYRSPEDMLSGPVEGKLRKAIKENVRPLPITPEAVRKVAPAQPPPPAPSQEVVLRQAATHTAPTPPPEPPPAPARQAPIPPAPAAPSPEATAVLEALAEERKALASMREALVAEKSSQGKPLGELLEERGLVGIDEAERAVRALAESRRLAELLPYLRVSDAPHVQRWLRDVLLLVDGTPPEAMRSEATVSVAPERAEIPNSASFRRQTEQISEALLLNGARRVLIVGGPIRLHRLLARAFDPRIELRFRPTERVVDADAQADVTRTDAVVLWNVEVDEDAATTYAGGRAIVARVPGTSLDALFKHWSRALAG